MRTSFAGEAAEFQATNYSTLALFVPLIERMKLESIIDRYLPVDAQAEFSLGKILTLLIAARLHFPNSRLPHEYYEIAEISHTLHDQQHTRDIPCRVLFVYSSADHKVVEQQRAKHLAKLQAGLEKLQKSVAAGTASTDPTSVARRIGALFGTKQAASFFHWQMVPLTAAEQQELPPRGRGCKQPTHRLEFRLDTAQVASVASYDGYSVLVTTVPELQASADALFTKLKEQNYSEHVNSRFKRPLQVRPVYLHQPERVEALVFLLMIALTVYFLLQRLYRQNQPTARERRMTTELLQRAFANYGLLLQHGGDQTRVYASRLTTRQREILAALEFFTPTQILNQRMAHPP